jgi:hypothetical protein
MKAIQKYVQSNEVHEKDNTFVSVILLAQQREVNGVQIWGECHGESNEHKG